MESIRNFVQKHKKKTPTPNFLKGSMRGKFLNQCHTSCINAQYEQQKFTCTYILFKKLLLSFTKTDLRGSSNKSCLYLQHCVCCRDQKPDQGPRKVYCTNSNSSRTPGSVPGCKTDPAWRTGNESLIPPTFDLPWPLPFTQQAILFFSCTLFPYSLFIPSLLLIPLGQK